MSAPDGPGRPVRGGYPSANVPRSQMKPPPASATRPKEAPPTDGRYSAARAAVALAGLAFLEEDRAAITETIAAAAHDGVLAEVAVAALEAYAGTLESLLGGEKARAVLERALEAAELDLMAAAPSAPPPE